MKNTIKLWILWGGLYLLCALLGFFPDPQGLWYGLFVLLGLGFFVPPSILLYDAVKTKNGKTLRILRLLSFLSLGLTLLMLVVNFLAVQASEAWGAVLYWILLLVSVPMVCAQAWVIGLFGWACLLMATFMFSKKK